MVRFICEDCGADLGAADLRVAMGGASETLYFCLLHSRVRRVDVWTKAAGARRRAAIRR
ncbi:MAG: hypothetical protein ACYDCK_11825 [Thermoplasmatota archaeon]